MTTLPKHLLAYIQSREFLSTLMRKVDLWVPLAEALRRHSTFMKRMPRKYQKTKFYIYYLVMQVLKIIDISRWQGQPEQSTTKN